MGSESVNFKCFLIKFIKKYTYILVDILSGDNGIKVTPISIPNTKVKHHADGTAGELCGRVGSCRLYKFM